MKRLHVCPALAVACLALAACSQQSAPTPQQRAAAQQAAQKAAAQKKLDMFHQLLAMQRPDLAIPIGQEILDKYPHTAAAAEVGEKLPAIKAKAQAEAEKNRLANLWLYQTGPMAGGTQSTATIDNSKPGDVHVRLILRRQTSWGTSAFLYDAPDKGFVCHKQCDLVMHFDGVRHVYTGYLPDGGEPAMFIKQYKSFIARLEKAKKVTMVATVKGKGRQTLVFETGGFVPGKWKALDHAKK